jgi:hypothetical protein
MTVTMAPTSRQMRNARRALGSALAGLLALVVFTGSVQAGRGYIYCVAMQEVMSHACCVHHQRATPAHTAAIERAAPDCCHAQTIPAIGHWTSPAPTFELPAPALAIVNISLLPRAAVGGDEIGEWDTRVRAGPPRSRVLARLMVLHI